jgi:hypothetical protein
MARRPVNPPAPGWGLTIPAHRRPRGHPADCRRRCTSRLSATTPTQHGQPRSTTMAPLSFASASATKNCPPPWAQTEKLPMPPSVRPAAIHDLSDGYGMAD